MWGNAHTFFFLNELVKNATHSAKHTTTVQLLSRRRDLLTGTAFRFQIITAHSKQWNIFSGF